MRRPNSWLYRQISIDCCAIVASIAKLPSIEEALAYPYSDAERAHVARNRSRLFVGSPQTVMQKISPLIAASEADEVMVITAVFDHEARKRSYSLLAKAFELGKQAASAT